MKFGFLVTVLGLVVCACAASSGLEGCTSPSILGGATPETTTHQCPDGTSCPNAYACPPLAGGDCEAYTTGPSPQWGDKKRPDAGGAR